jgi:hypothetical protein
MASNTIPMIALSFSPVFNSAAFSQNDYAFAGSRSARHVHARLGQRIFAARFH